MQDKKYSKNKSRVLRILLTLFFIGNFSGLVTAQVPVPGNNGVNPIPPSADPNAVLPAQPSATQATIQATPQSAEVPAVETVPEGNPAAVSAPAPTVAPSPTTAEPASPPPLPQPVAEGNTSTEAEAINSVESQTVESVQQLNQVSAVSADQTVTALPGGPKPWPLPPKQLRLLYPDLSWPKVSRESDTVYSTKSSFDLDTPEQVREKLGNYCANSVEQYQTDAKEILQIDDLTNYFGQICNYIDQFIAVRGITYTDLDVHRQTLNAQLDSAFFSAYHLPFREMLSKLAQQQRPAETSLLTSFGVPQSMTSIIKELLLFLALILSLLAFFKDTLRNKILNKFAKKSESPN